MSFLENAITNPDLFCYRAVVCTALLGRPIWRSVALSKLGVNDDNGGGWAWPLTEIEPLFPPAPARGAQGFWEWTRP